MNYFFILFKYNIIVIYVVEFNLKTITIFVIGLLITAIIFPIAITAMVGNPIEQKTESSLRLTQTYESNGCWFNATPSQSNRFYVDYFIVVNESVGVNVSLYANDTLENDFSSVSTLTNRTMQTQIFSNLTVALGLFIEFDNTTATLSITANVTEFVPLDGSNSVQAIYALLPIIACFAILAVMVNTYFKNKDE